MATVTTAPVLDTESTLSLRVFVDTSSIEVFGNGGRFAITNLVFPKSPYTTLTVSSEGGKGNISNLKVYSHAVHQNASRHREDKKPEKHK